MVQGFRVGCLAATKRCIPGISVEEFFTEYWGKKPWTSPVADTNRFADLFSMEAADQVFAMQEPDDTRPRSEIDAYRTGKTATCGRLAEKWPGLAKLEHELENFFGTKVHMGAILTPKHVTEEGITKPHYDVSDLFFLQISGRKRWRIYAATEPHTYAPKPFIDPATLPNPTPLVDVELEPGRVLYVPGGCTHQNDSVGDHSLHVTVALQMPRWSQLVGAYVQQFIEAHQAEMPFRGRIPPRCFQHTDPEVQAVLGGTRQILGRIAESVDEASIYKCLFGMLTSQQAAYRGHLDKVKYIELFTGADIEDLVFFIRDDQLLHIEASAQERTISTLVGTLELPAEAEPAIRFMLDASRDFKASEVPAIDRAETRVMLGELIFEGILGCRRARHSH